MCLGVEFVLIDYRVPWDNSGNSVPKGALPADELMRLKLIGRVRDFSMRPKA